MKTDHLFNLDQRLSMFSDPLKASDTEAESMQLWVPSECVSLHLVDIPSAPQRKWDELVPWMLEERLLQPADEMHFVVVGREQDQLQVMVVHEQSMQEWIRIADNAGVSAIAMSPDYMALPWEPGLISVGWREGIVLVRQSATLGFAAVPEIAWEIINGIVQQSEVSPKLSISIPEPSGIPPHLVDIADINQASPDWEFATYPAVNLMVSKFKPKSKASSTSFWWPVAASFLLTIVLGMVSLNLSSRALEAEIEVLQDQAVSHYSSLFGGSKPKPEAVRIITEQKIESLFQQQQSLKAFPVASLTALDKIMNNCQCELQSLSADGSNLTITLSNADKLMKKSLKVPGFQLSLKPDVESDQFVLRLQPEVTRRAR
jgi:general secretion pathway protein L